MASKYNDYEDKDFIRALNPGVKMEYKARHTTLLNNVMFITAQVINKSLKIDLFDYEKDVFSHNFFKESEVNTFVEGMFVDPINADSVDEIENITIGRLQTMQEYLKNLCKDVIESKKHLILESNYITPSLLYNLYNNGNCLPQEYNNIESKVLKYLDIDFNNLTKNMIYDINNNLLFVVYNFGIPEIGSYLHGFDDKVLMDIYKSKFGYFNPLKLLFNNLDLMAKHLIAHCLIIINNIKLKTKPISSTTSNLDSPLNNAASTITNDDNQPVPLVMPLNTVPIDGNIFYQLFNQANNQQSQQVPLVNDINNAIINTLGGKVS